MSSRFISMDASQEASSGVFKNLKRPEKIWFQFVPGIVQDVVTSTESATYTTPRDINSIIAYAHYGNNQPRAKGANRTRYYPLLRNYADTPVKGDPVLLCTFGGVNYYLGPINTANNINFNIDHLNQPSLAQKGAKKKSTDRDRSGLSKNFIRVPYNRLQKPYNKELDGKGKAEKDIHGDFIQEGRHGNSIRMGSRDIHPYMVFSNGRGAKNIVESTYDGSFIAMLHKGTIAQHFPYDAILEGKDVNKSPFKFSADDDRKDWPGNGGKAPNISLTKTVTSSLGRGTGGVMGANEDDSDIAKTLYGFEEPHILMNSNRLIFNARTDTIFMSAMKHLHFASQDSISMSTNKNWVVNAEVDAVIQAPRIVIGPEDDEKTEPIVLGDTCVEWQDNLLKMCEKICKTIMQQTHPTGCGPSGPPINAGAFAAIISSDIGKLRSDIEKKLSKVNRTQ